MMSHKRPGPRASPMSRRDLIATVGIAAGVFMSTPRRGHAQGQGAPQGPPTTITNPPRDFGPNAPPTTYFNDPDVLTIDPLFNQVIQPNAAIKRLWTGALWTEGPAWSAQGRYLVFSDIPNNRQMRWIEDDDRVT